MKCSYCNKEIPGIICPGCKETVPEESRYCLHCGAMLKDDPQAVDDSASAGEKDDIDFDSRALCIDGNCIGIIVNGKCNICGKRHKGKKK
jgi:predicted amidophosphoribosyltransferase